MKRLPRRCRNLFVFLATSIVASSAAFAALNLTEWQHRQSLKVEGPGLTRADLSAASFDHAAGPALEDFRVIDASGKEVAFLAAVPPTQGFGEIAPAAFDVKLESDATRLLITTGTKSKLSSLSLKTPAPHFLRSATVEISDDNLTWTKLDQGVPLFRQWGAEKLDVSLGDRTANYVQITINDRRTSPIPFTAATLKLKAGEPVALVPTSTTIAQRDEFAGESVLTLFLDARYVPLAKLSLAVSDPLFMRRVTVSVREVNGGVPHERLIGSGSIYRVELDGSPARAQLDVPLNFTPLTRELLVHIHNGDSPPLTIGEVQAKRHDLHLLFMAPTAGSYSLLSGNPQATRPHYDLASFSSEMHAASVTKVTLGEIEATPGYQPRESLGNPSLPDVPLEGAPLDTKDWSQNRALTLKRAGVQELELDPAALAKAQSDLGDLRLLRHGNQIPYILERPDLARAMTLQPVASPDAKRPATSIWQLKLPHTGLQLRRLVLTSTTPLFQRNIRIYEKLTNQNGGAYELTLASGQWSRTPEPEQSETKVFEVSDRARTDTLWIETDNGDNPAIALGAVQAIYPVVRLIFKTAGSDDVSLVYGNPSANTPRYDLSLVATKLLTSPRNSAQLATAGADSNGSRNPFTALRSGYIFWGALALVVVALLAVVAKLLPKPPAP